MQYIIWTLRAACILSLTVLANCANPTSPAIPIRLGTSQEHATIQTLQKRLREQEQTIAIQTRQIEVLSSQLDDLKRIEQDMEERRKFIRPPAATFTSPEKSIP
jgi:uncharacterized coiled-coil protein SlyX